MHYRVTLINQKNKAFQTSVYAPSIYEAQQYLKGSKIKKIERISHDADLNSTVDSPIKRTKKRRKKV